MAMGKSKHKEKKVNTKSKVLKRIKMWDETREIEQAKILYEVIHLVLSLPQPPNNNLTSWKYDGKGVNEVGLL